MSNVDIVLGLFALSAIIWGTITGLSGMLFQAVALFTGLYFYPELYATLFLFFNQIGLPNAFITLFILAITFIPLLWLAWKLNQISRKILKILWVNWINSLLGALLGFVCALWLILPLWAVLTHFPEKEPLISFNHCQESKVCPWLIKYSDPLWIRMKTETEDF
jgi:uncharacterized membrane protein required for colicin V production